MFDNGKNRNEWPNSKLVDVCDLITDGSHFSPKPQTSGWPIANVRDLRPGFVDIDSCTKIKENDFQILMRNGCGAQRNDVLFSKDGTIGKVVVYTQQENLVVLSSIGILRPANQLNPFFLGQALQSSDTQRQIDILTAGSALRRMVLRDIKRISIPFPSIPEQGAIAAILGMVDEAIRRTEALVEKLRRVKAGLLHDLLTRGLDEHGQLRDPIHHPGQFKDSPMGKIPKEWKDETLEKACVKIQDGTHFSPQSNSGPFMYITSRNIRFGYMDLSDIGFISQREHEEIYRRCDVRYGDVLLTKDGANTGNAALSTIEEPYSLLSSVALLRCDEKLLHNVFLLNTLISPRVQKEIQDLMSGNAITRLTLEKINGIKIVLPPFEEQLAIARNINSLQDGLSREEIFFQKLYKIKNGLMQDLLTGRGRVPKSLINSLQPPSH